MNKIIEMEHDLYIDGVHIRTFASNKAKFKTVRVLGGREKTGLLMDQSWIAFRDVRKLREIVLTLVNRVKAANKH